MRVEHIGDAVLWQGDALAVLREMPECSVQTCVTSPPYWGLRDYGVAGQLGLERTPEEYTAKMVEVFREVRRVLRDDGTLWLNLGDSYAATTKGTGGIKSLSGGGALRPNGRSQPQMEPVRMNYGELPIKPKDLVGIPWRVAFALQADGWYLRSDIIWAKPNPMPESVTDRPTKAHEYLFLLSKKQTYYYDAEAIKEKSSGLTGGRFGDGGEEVGRLRQDAGRERPEDDGFRNRRTVWTVPTAPCAEAHFATFPPALITPCILAGAPEGGVVLDLFLGAGTTALTALSLDRKAIGIELNPEYMDICVRRISEATAQGSLFKPPTKPKQQDLIKGEP